MALNIDYEAVPGTEQLIDGKLGYLSESRPGQLEFAYNADQTA